MSCIDKILDLRIDFLKSSQKKSNSSTKLTKGVEKIFNKINLDNYTNSFANFEVKTQVKKEQSQNPNDFGLSIHPPFKKREDKFYNDFIANNTNISFGAFFNPNQVNQLIYNSKLVYWESSVKLMVHH